MGSGEQELPEAEIAQGGDGSAADDGKPPLEPIAQAAEQSEQVVIDLHAVGRVGYGGQRSVEIEEQRGPGQPSSEEHTSELQSLMPNSYAVFCLKKKTHKHLSLHVQP